MDDHAKQNAAAWLASIVEMIARLTSDDSGVSEQAREEIEQSPLSIMVRDGWRSSGQQHDATAEEFEILLSTGGRALRIRGDLDSDEPTSAELEYQDWGTPWTRFPLDNDARCAVEAFARCFYFGEG